MLVRLELRAAGLSWSVSAQGSLYNLKTAEMLLGCLLFLLQVYIFLAVGYRLHWLCLSTKIECPLPPIILPSDLSSVWKLFVACQQSNNRGLSCSYVLWCASLSQIQFEHRADVMFPPRCCSRAPRGQLHGVPRLACWSWDWLLSFLELCQVQLHPSASLSWTSSSSQRVISVLSAVPSLCLAHSAPRTCLVVDTESQQEGH